MGVHYLRPEPTSGGFLFFPKHPNVIEQFVGCAGLMTYPESVRHLREEHGWSLKRIEREGIRVNELHDQEHEERKVLVAHEHGAFVEQAIRLSHLDPEREAMLLAAWRCSSPGRSVPLEYDH